MNTQELIKELIWGVAPIGAGVYLFDKSSSINLIISIPLLIFGCVIIGILVSNFLRREKVMRSHCGYAYLK